MNFENYSITAFFPLMDLTQNTSLCMTTCIVQTTKSLWNFIWLPFEPMRFSFVCHSRKRFHSSLYLTNGHFSWYQIGNMKSGHHKVHQKLYHLLPYCSLLFYLHLEQHKYVWNYKDRWNINWPCLDTHHEWWWSTYLVNLRILTFPSTAHNQLHLRSQNLKYVADKQIITRKNTWNSKRKSNDRLARLSMSMPICHAYSLCGAHLINGDGSDRWTNNTIPLSQIQFLH